MGVISERWKWWEVSIEVDGGWNWMLEVEVEEQDGDLAPFIIFSLSLENFDNKIRVF